MALTGGLAGAGKPALIAMEIWRDDINAKGGLLGRPVEFVYYDDQTQPANVPKIYTAVERRQRRPGRLRLRHQPDRAGDADHHAQGMVFMSLFALAANEQFNYDRYFQIMPAGPEPKEDWSRPFIKLATDNGLQTIALVGADAEFSQNALEGAHQCGRGRPRDRLRRVLSAEHRRTSRRSSGPSRRPIRTSSSSRPYPPDSAGMVRAANELGLQTKLFGGGMVGLQYASLLTSLGPMLNGIVNYDFWVRSRPWTFPASRSS